MKMSYSRKVINRSNNERGKTLERLIDQACIYYMNKGIAMIEKTPEPFNVKKKSKDSFIGYFTKKAQPDFKGALAGGRAVVFEAKSTSAKKISQSVISENQEKCLDAYQALGAFCGVCIIVNKTVAFIEWSEWKNMKQKYGRKYMTEKEVTAYQIPTPMYADFLYHYLKHNA